MLNNLKKRINFILTDHVGSTNSFFRENWLKSVLNEIPKGMKILDAGAGETQYKKFCSHLDYVSQDFAEYDGVGNSKGIHKESRDYSNLDIISDICSIPVSDNTFDVVMCIEVFEHLPNPIDALVELTRVLKPGGILILTAPFASLTHYAPYHFATGFNKYFYEHHLKELKYKSIEITANGNYFEFLAQEIRRIKTVSLKYSKINAGILIKLAINIVLYFLNQSTKKDSGSEELLNFGYNVKCIKSNNIEQTLEIN